MDGLTARVPGFLLLLTCWLTSPDTSTAAVTLVTVNNTRITDGDLELEILSRSQKPEELSPEVKAKILEDLIDRELISQHLSSLRVRYDGTQVQLQLKLLKETIAAADKDPDQTLDKLGLNEAKLAQRLRLGSMWQNYFSSVIGEEQLQQYFNNHKQQFDGTEVRASQILIKLPANPSPADISAAQTKLESFRKQILSGDITFADAARKWSEAPSAATGGDLGFAPYRGKRLRLYSDKLFPLEAGEITKPFQSPFGMHLMQVTERKPGTFEFVDVRGIVLKQLKEEFWNATVSDLRKKSKISYSAQAPRQ